MKMDSAGIQNMEYTETCKIIRKKLSEDIRNFNLKMKDLKVSKMEASGSKRT